MRFQVSPCRLCGTLPKVGRTATRGGWVIFCDGLDHYVEVRGESRHPTMLAWERLHGHAKRLARADHEYLQRLYRRTSSTATKEIHDDAT
jgi:hypothetical protein